MCEISVDLSCDQDSLKKYKSGDRDTSAGTLLVMLLQATIIRNYFVKTQTYVASFGPPDLSIIFSTGMYLEVFPL